MTDELIDFEGYVNGLWEEAMHSDLITQVAAGEIYKDPVLVAIYLTQVYHYAFHTPRHQALVGANRYNTDVHYMQYCFEHALEETGHELMALSDIRSLGYGLEAEDIPVQLPSTQLLIAYLYKQAQSENPVHHLGYGFWSENACPFIDQFMQSLMIIMGLERKQMTFYSSHVTIDEGHAKEVRNIIQRVARSGEDWKGMKQVARITFDLTLGMVRDSVHAYEQFKNGESDDFRIFREVKSAVT